MSSVDEMLANSVLRYQTNCHAYIESGRMVFDALMGRSKNGYDVWRPISGCMNCQYATECPLYRPEG